MDFKSGLHEQTSQHIGAFIYHDISEIDCDHDSPF